MEKVLIKFKDEEIGDEIVFFKYNEKKYDFFKTMNLAKEILYLDFQDCFYKELLEKCPQLTKKLYKKAMEILDGGYCGVTAERFCEFMESAFGWKYEFIKADLVFDVECGDWDYED